MDFQTRRTRLRKSFTKEGIDALLVTDFVNVTYLTGFTGDDSYLFLGRHEEVILSDPRYTVQLGEEAPGVDLHIRAPGVPMTRAIERVVKAAKAARLGIEGDSMTVGLRDQIAKKLPKLPIIATSGLVEELRLIKDKEEVARIRTAVGQAEMAFAALRTTLRPEMTEKEAADELEHQFRLFGGKNASFPSIVAVGPRAALPHATPGPRRIGEDHFTLVDWGVNEGLYCSDLTRMLITGRISPKLERVYQVVLEAQVKAIAAVRPGVTGHDVDSVARSIIAKAGFGRRFRHGLGHGLGMLVHEAPRLAVKSQTILKPGMVVTVEPGVYLPGWGGVRIEDDVLVTRTGHEVLTHAPKQLEDAVVS